MNTKLEIALFVITGITIIIGIFWVVKTEARLKRFFIGKKGKDLEDTILELSKNLEELKQAKEKTEREIATLYKKSRKSISGLEMIRFNPFKDQGSNQSFAIGMLNEEGDGVVMSSLYSRERMSVFAKPVKGGTSEYELTNEEKEVLKKAEVNK